jgi:hypothetical protein
MMIVLVWGESEGCLRWRAHTSGARCCQSAQWQFDAQVLPEAHSHSAPQLQSAPQLHCGPQAQLSSREAHAQVSLQLQDLVSNSFVIGVSLAVRI